jgi:hypothetical protein
MKKKTVKTKKLEPIDISSKEPLMTKSEQDELTNLQSILGLSLEIAHNKAKTLGGAKEVEQESRESKHGNVDDLPRINKKKK